MRMIKTPAGLKITKFEEVAGPRLLGQVTTLSGLVQSNVDPFGLWVFRVSYAPMQRAAARAFEKWRTGFLAGGNCSRFHFFDADEPSFQELGLPPQKTALSSSGQPCSNGQPWKLGLPICTVVAPASKDTGLISIDVNNWNGVVPAWLGFVGYFGVYKVIGEQVHNNIATLRVWPPLRHSIGPDDRVTMRPIICMTLAEEKGATGYHQGHFYQGAGLMLREVLHETVHKSVVED